MQAVKLAKSGKSVELVANDFGVSRATVYKWLAKYKGKRSISKFQNKQKSGRPKVGKKCDWSYIYRILERPASRYGFDSDLWNVTRVKQVIEKEFNCTISRNTVWRRLREANLLFKTVQNKFDKMRQSDVDDWL